jgi:glycosyltransferase involved in cell wall biosynthesis
MMDRRPPPAVAIVVPCYNEEAALPETVARLIQVVDDLIAMALATPDSAIYFVDDGSGDRTWDIIRETAAGNRCCHGIKLARNYGHQNALLSGLLSVPGDAVITIDADLQDEVNAMKEMLAAYRAGSEIVYGARRGRQSDTRFKRLTAEGYYRLLSAMGVRLVFNHADYRLLSRRAVETLKEFRERNLFLRGIIPQLGFNSAIVYYERHERVAGESKYPFRKMLAFAVVGITSFSAVPLTLITLLGMLVAVASFFSGVWALWVRAFNPAAVPGWASTVVPVSFLGGIQLLCTGIIGQYLAKIYIETKARPRFTIDETV